MGIGVRLVGGKGDWRETVKRDKIERKLRKMAVKLLRWAQKNGVDSVDVYVNPLTGFVHAYSGNASFIDFIRDGEL